MSWISFVIFLPGVPGRFLFFLLACGKGLGLGFAFVFWMFSKAPWEEESEKGSLRIFILVMCKESCEQKKTDKFQRFSECKRKKTKAIGVDKLKLRKYINSFGGYPKYAVICFI